MKASSGYGWDLPPSLCVSAWRIPAARYQPTTILRLPCLASPRRPAVRRRPADPLRVALTRMAGLAGGVATMMALSVVVLPKSATVEVLHT